MFWLSFVGEDGPLGVTVVHADSSVDAVERAHQLGLNPGGEVLSVEIPAECAEYHLRYLDRLSTPEELDTDANIVRLSQAELDERFVFEEELPFDPQPGAPPSGSGITFASPDDTIEGLLCTGDWVEIEVPRRK